MLLFLPVQSQPQKYAPVRHLMLYLTEECNLRCTYCFVKKEPRFMRGPLTKRKKSYAKDFRLTSHRSRSIVYGAA
jgi:MoaA/NifB/PqqE/SkfB family radical SAM enzyme